jgi:galactokinase
MTLTRTVYENTAPGRMDVMGGIADYSGSLVLQMAIHEKTTVKVRLHNDGVCRVTSDNEGSTPLHAEIRLDDLLAKGRVDYAVANRRFRSNMDSLWSGYVVGCVLVLQQEKGINFTGGDFQVSSNVPIGKGVSSSASLEVATMKALADAFQITFQGTELPVLAQKVENLIVGAPCGLMDQLTTCFGEPGKLLPIICQPDKVLEKISVNPPLRFVGIDSGVRHSVGGASYGDVRCAAFMGYTMLAHSLGIGRKEIEFAKKTGDRSLLPYDGYLCNISPAEFELRFRSILPDVMEGRDFIQRFGATTDLLSDVQPDKSYRVFDCSTHPIYENDRVYEFMKIISCQTKSKDDLMRLGQLMFESHESYSRCGLGSDRTDEIVNQAKSFLNDGVFGAKITGGGSGGTVCLLVDGPEGLKHAREIHRRLCVKYSNDLVFVE